LNLFFVDHDATSSRATGLRFIRLRAWISSALRAPPIAAPTPELDRVNRTQRVRCGWSEHPRRHEPRCRDRGYSSSMLQTTNQSSGMLDVPVVAMRLSSSASETGNLREQIELLIRSLVRRGWEWRRKTFISRWFPSILKVLTVIRPETLVRWHRARFRSY